MLFVASFINIGTGHTLDIRFSTLQYVFIFIKYFINLAQYKALAIVEFHITIMMQNALW